MRHHRMPAIAVAALLAVAVGASPALPAAAPIPTTLQDGGKSSAKKEKFALVRVGTDYRVTPAKDVKALKKSVADQYKTALRGWNARKRAAKKKKAKFVEPRPKKQSFKVLGSSFASLEAANARMNKLKEKEAAKHAKQRAKPKGKAGRGKAGDSGDK